MTNGSNLPVPYQPPSSPYYPPYQPPIIYTGGGKKSSGSTALTLGIVAITLVGGGFALWWVFKKKSGGDIASKLSFEMEPLQESVVPGQTVAVNVTVTNNSEEDLSPEIEFDIKCSCRSTVNESNEWVSFGTIAPGESATNEMSMTVPADWSGTDPEVIYGRVLCKGHSGTVLNDVIANITPIGGPSGEFEIDRGLSGWVSTTIDAGGHFAYKIHWKTGATPVPVRWVVGIRDTALSVHLFEYNYTPQTLPANSSGDVTVFSIVTTAAGKTYDGVVTSDPTDNTGQEIFPSTPDCLFVNAGGSPPVEYTIDDMEAVEPAVLYEGGKATVNVSVTNNGTSPITNKSFRLDLKLRGQQVTSDLGGGYYGTSNVTILVTGVPKIMNIAIGSVPFQISSAVIPTSIGQGIGAWTVEAKLLDVTVASDIKPLADDTTTFSMLPKGVVYPYSNETFIISQTPSDKKVTNGMPITFKIGVISQGAPTSWEVGCYIKTENPYWLRKTFVTPASAERHTNEVTVSGTFTSNLTKRNIEVLCAVFRQGKTPYSVPPVDQNMSFANWDWALTC